MLIVHIILSLWQAIFGGVIRSRVQVWCMQLKGPLYVPMFKPFGIIYASFFGITFFGNSIYYGRWDDILLSQIITSFWGD